MELKDLLKATKVDRYTQDGRDELNNALQADVEDTTYKIGDISQKTGLQKTANGWVKPKGGAKAKKSAKPESKGPRQKEENPAEKMNQSEGQEAILEQQKAKAGQPRNPDFDLSQAGLGEKKTWQEKQVEKLNKKIEQKKSESKPDGADRLDEIGGEIKGNLGAAKYYFDKAQSFYPTDPSYKTYMLKAKEYNDMAKNQADDYGFDFEEMHNSGITTAVNNYAKEQSEPAAESEGNKKPAVEPTDEEYDIFKQIVREFRKSPNKKNEQIMNEAKSFLMKKGMTPEQLGKIAREVMAEPKDAAPRQLTGDTRIKVRK